MLLESESCIDFYQKKYTFQSVTTKSSNMQNHRAKPTNNETLYWYKESLENGKVSEEKFKSEAITFFNLSPEQSTQSGNMDQ